MPSAPGPLLARGRMADVFDVGRGLVLRRYRDATVGAEREASVMGLLHEAGYPVPRVESVDGPDLVMERLDGPTMLADLGRHPWRIPAHARALARLHDRLGRIEAPATLRTPLGAGTSMLHLDLHPDNVVLTRRGPVVIDWTNAARGPAAADVADTWMLLACVRPEDGLPFGPLGAGAVAAFTRLFVRHVDGNAARRALTVVRDYRASDRNMSHHELDRMSRLVARETARPG